MNPEIRKAMRKRNRLHSKFLKNNTKDVWWAKYITQRNIVNSLIRKAKRERTKIDIDKINNMTDSTLDWWKLVKTHFGPNNESAPALHWTDNDGKTIFANTDKDKADAPNDYFVSVTRINDFNHIFPRTPPKTTARLDSLTLTSDDVFKSIDTLLSNKSPGPDWISPYILK